MKLELRYVYPDYKYENGFTNNVEHNKILTYVRKKHTDGKYYLVLHLYRLKGQDLMTAMYGFQEQVYRYITRGVVNIDHKDTFGDHTDVLDENQEDETKRLI